MRGPNDKCSTWSPEVLDFSDCDDDESFEAKLLEYAEEPRNKRLRRSMASFASGGYKGWEGYDFKSMPGSGGPCGNCQLVCWPKLEDRQENYGLLKRSGRVDAWPVRDPDK